MNADNVELNSPRSSAASLLGLAIANLTVFTSSFCIMVIELVAGRVVAKYLGSSLYTWTSIIGVVLAGIAIGNYMGGRIADRYAIGRSASHRTLAVLFLLAGIISFGINLYNAIAGGIEPLGLLSWPWRVATHVALVFFLPSAMLGTISPVIAKMALDLGRQTGRTLGSVYAWGVVGSIFGTFMTGFWFVAVFRTSTIILSVSAVLTVTAVLYGLASFRRSGNSANPPSTARSK